MSRGAESDRPGGQRAAEGVRRQRRAPEGDAGHQQEPVRARSALFTTCPATTKSTAQLLKPAEQLISLSVCPKIDVDSEKILIPDICVMLFR